MECEVRPENGPGCCATGKEVGNQRNFKCDRHHIGRSQVRLRFPVTVLGKVSDQQMYLSVAPLTSGIYESANNNVPSDIPFMNNMDEISYWIHTKRAPCLMNYDNLVKKQNEEAQNSKTKPKTVFNVVQELTPVKKRKKRKLLLHSDHSMSDNNRKNEFLKTSPNKNIKNTNSSGGLGSDIDFNIKNSSVVAKPKRVKLKKHSKTILDKKIKLVSSTPKVTSLRRSLRQKQQSVNSSPIKMSLTFNSSIVNGNHLQKYNGLDNNLSHKLEQPNEIIVSKEHSHDKKNTNNGNLNNDAQNGHFDDMSDMSGFTANYIRSTKVQSKKTPQKLRGKTSKNLIKESRTHNEKDNATLLCVNKSVNTEVSKNPFLNCSTDSSQNVNNLVSTQNNDKSLKANENTSLSKCLDKTENNESLDDRHHQNHNIDTTTSRYPTRNKTAKAINNQQIVNLKNANKNTSEFDNAVHKNPEEALALRTRSGRSVGLKLHHLENSVVVLSSSSGHMSSAVSFNLASPNGKLNKKKLPPRRTVQTRQNGKAIQRYSVRNRSGFTACFSDSDGDSEPLLRKFFCA